MLPAEERRKAQRATDDGEVSVNSYSLLKPDPSQDLGIPIAGSPQKEFLFSGLSASTIEADKLFVYQHASTFDREHWHQKYDYVMVFPMMGPGQSAWKENADGNEASHRARDLVKRMISVGLELFPYLSIQGDELIILITCPEATISKFTDKIDFKLELDPAYCRDKLSKGDKERKIKPVKITDDPQYTHIHPFEHVFGKYDSALDPKIYLIKEGSDSPFDRPTRLKIMHYMLTMPQSEGGCGIKLSSLLLKKEILAFYPPHNEMEKDLILKASSGFFTMPWHQPIEQIRDYMGEKVSLYYVFMGHYSKWLLAPAMIGLVFELVGTYLGMVSHNL